MQIQFLEYILHSKPTQQAHLVVLVQVLKEALLFARGDIYHVGRYKALEKTEETE